MGWAYSKVIQSYAPCLHINVEMFISVILFVKNLKMALKKAKF